MNVTDRMILTVTGVGIILTVTFTPSCITELHGVDRDAVGERYCGPVEIDDVSYTSGVTFMKDSTRSDLTIVMFTRRNVTVNKTYTVHGKIDMYHGRLEIIADRLRPARP